MPGAPDAPETPAAPSPLDAPASSAGRHELYIYYRALDADSAALHDAVGALQSGLRALHPGLHARLLQRPASDAGQRTWMEVYLLPAHADPAQLAASIERAAQVLAPWIPGGRHVEHFIASEA